MLNGSVQGEPIVPDPADDNQIFSFSFVAMSTSGGEYVVRRNVEERKYSVHVYYVLCVYIHLLEVTKQLHVLKYLSV